jgi:hypothetical protein
MNTPGYNDFHNTFNFELQKIQNEYQNKLQNLRTNYNNAYQAYQNPTPNVQMSQAVPGSATPVDVQILAAVGEMKSSMEDLNKKVSEMYEAYGAGKKENEIKTEEPVPEAKKQGGQAK